MRSLVILFSVVSLAVKGGSFLDMDSVRSEIEGDLVFVFHEVEEEETLFAIARRYKSTVPSIIKLNRIAETRIEIGQLLRVLYEERRNTPDLVAETPKGFHLVLPGETLYSISRSHDLKIRELRKMNGLSSNDISPGEYLRVREEISTIDPPNDSLRTADYESGVDTIRTSTGIEIPEGFEPYIVQTAETLNSIARKRKVSVSELKEWNKLDSDYIRIGQTLMVIQLNDSLQNLSDSTQVVTKLNEDGFEKVYEEGIAAIISEISTSKYLALHRSMPIGTELEVRNLMNNFVVHVKVVGKLPDTGMNRNILLRLSKPAFERLGILDPKSRVEVSHFKR